MTWFTVPDTIPTAAILQAKKGKGEANPRRMAALLVEHLEEIREVGQVSSYFR